MSPASSLRSHFIKHHKFFICATNLFSFHGGIHSLRPPSHLSAFAAPKATPQSRRLNIAALNFSTLPFSSSVNDDSYNSPYLSVNLSCPRHLSDAFSESLICFGAGSIIIDERENLESAEQIWIRSTFNVDQDVKHCISRAANSVGLKEMPVYKVEMRDNDIDWIKKSQESFHPVEITEGLWIVPEWRKPPNLDATNIILNPGLAFGTGEHPTTKLCLLLLHRLIKGGEHFLDYGTGSGVLAIAALKMGANLSVGFDIEPQAITSAQHNATLNNIEPGKLLLSLVPSKNEPQLESEGGFLYNSEIISQTDQYNVVIANILLHPLLDLADRIVSYAKPGAIVGLSGILSDQVQTVIEHYSLYLEDINVSMVDDWACISGSKKKDTSKINLVQL